MVRLKIISQGELDFMNSNSAFCRSAARGPRWFFILLSVTALTACQKSDTIPTTAERLKSVEQKQQTEPDFYVPRKAVDYMSDLKSIKENTPRAAAVVAPTAAPAAAPATAPAEVKTAVTETRSATPAAPTPVPAPAAVQAVTPPSAPSANIVASTAPTARPTPAKDVAAALTLLSQEQPEFPRDALRDGVAGGRVKAKLTIDAAGGVSDVVIVEATPPRVFNRAVTQALSRWKFNPGAEGRTFVTEVTFKL